MSLSDVVLELTHELHAHFFGQFSLKTPIKKCHALYLSDIVQFILKGGGDPNIRDNEENTGLHWASYAGDVNIAELFINAG